MEVINPVGGGVKGCEPVDLRRRVVVRNPIAVRGASNDNSPPVGGGELDLHSLERTGVPSDEDEIEWVRVSERDCDSVTLAT